MRLGAKTALVTGAASGFGAEIARVFAREGAKVVLMDLNAEGASEVARSIGDAARAIRGDVTVRADFDSAVQSAVTLSGRLDIIVNNAGWTHRNKPVLEVSEEEFDRVYAINVKSIFHVVNAAVPTNSKAQEELSSRMVNGNPPDTFQNNAGWNLLKWVVYNGRDDLDTKLEPLDFIAQQNQLTTVEGEPLAVSARGKKVYVTDVKGNTVPVTIPNVMQSNGVIHVVSGVLMP